MTPDETRTILVVEDDGALRNVLTRRLERSGYEVMVCASGDEAIRVCHEHVGEIDLVLSDMVMPGITGAEAARRIAEERPTMPIVFMSGFMRDDKVAAACAGPNRYFLEKPFEAETLAAVLDQAFHDAPPSSS